MSRGLFATISRVLADAGVTRAVRATSPAPRRRQAAHDLVTAGFLIVAALLLPAPAFAQSGQIVEYYHLDALGSVRVVTDQTGQVVSRHDFLPFGEEWPAPQPTTKEKKLFTGHERDAETGLDYFGARYYRASVGRFSTVDPELSVKEAVVDPQRWNRYAYVTNNPLKYTDPDGKNPLLITGSIGAAVYGGWAIYENVSHGRAPLSGNVGFEAAKGFVVGATLGIAGPAFAGMGGAETALAGSATATGTVVIGSYPRYLELARELGAKSFNIPRSIWEKMSEAQQLAANDKFLDRAISRGQTFIVTMNVADALKKGGVWLRHEIDYLMARGYTIGSDGRSLIPPAK
ncbi:MAG: RHS repeat-associated core domain-containing protein [Acidobacteria bacterium]|nr:RHS repeat-associated core domain-containing protein [Acidobacteriota bacterium]